MFFRSQPSFVALVLYGVVAFSTLVAASEPHLRAETLIVAEDEQQHQQRQQQLPPFIDSYDENKVDFAPKMELGFDKSLSCKGGNDPHKGGAGKKCSAKLKKAVSIGLIADELMDGMAADLQDMFLDLMPKGKDYYMDDDDFMSALLDMDNMKHTETIDEMEDGSSKTVKMKGFFKLDWDCTITWKKGSGLELSKTVECGAKSLQGVGRPEKD